MLAQGIGKASSADATVEQRELRLRVESSKSRKTQGQLDKGACLLKEEMVDPVFTAMLLRTIGL
jgi:hypothetical protein